LASHESKSKSSHEIELKGAETAMVNYGGYGKYQQKFSSIE
jgi:hypothetical protein